MDESIEMPATERIDVTTEVWKKEDVPKKLGDFFRNESDTHYIIERTDCVVMDKLDKEKLKDNLDLTTALRCFSPGCELRLEREMGEDSFRCRTLKSESGEEYHYVERDYLLSKTPSIKIKDLADGKGEIRCREYFRLDEDGMAWPAFERLVGVKEGGEER